MWILIATVYQDVLQIISQTHPIIFLQPWSCGTELATLYHFLLPMASTFQWYCLSKCNWWKCHSSSLSLSQGVRWHCVHVALFAHSLTNWYPDTSSTVTSSEASLSAQTATMFLFLGLSYFNTYHITCHDFITHLNILLEGHFKSPLYPSMMPGHTRAIT